MPGTDPQDIQGLSTPDMYGADACVPPTSSLGALALSGGVVYAVGCHGGLAVPGSCRTDLEHSLDLPQTFLSRGVVAYVANSGYGWGLKYGIGYGARLTQIFTEQMTSGGTVAVGDVVKQSKQRYYLETPRYDAYDEKSVMQWTLYGLPMYAVKTGIDPGAAKVTERTRASAPCGAGDPDCARLRRGDPPGRPSDLWTERNGRRIASPLPNQVASSQAQAEVPAPHQGDEWLGSVRVVRELRGIESSSMTANGESMEARPEALPTNLTQLSLSFDFTAGGVYTKHDSTGAELAAGPGCADPNGCYYTLNGLVDRGTGSGDLPIQPYLIYDSRLSGTSQHGVLWKGGSYDEETNWTPVIAELVSNGGNGSNHGSAPRGILIRPTAPRVVPGVDSPTCRPSDLEVNSLTLTAGEALKPQTEDAIYSIARRYRTMDLEVFYFNNRTTPGQNCDRVGPELGVAPYAGKYHAVAGTTVSWSVPATDTSGVWRVLAVYTTNGVDAQSQGTWLPVELVKNGSGVFEGNVTATPGTRLTYVLQAVDNRGNVTWLDYESAQLPASGVKLGVPETVDVSIGVPLDAPTNVVATAATTTSVGVSWSAVTGATGYDVYRKQAGGSFVKIGASATTGYTDATAASGAAYLYRVRATAGGSESPDSAADLATTVIFTDATLIAGTTKVKAAHVIELRTAVNAVRTLAGLGGATWTDASIAVGTTQAKAAHLTELRSALDAARGALALASIGYADPAITAGTTRIKAAQLEELRSGVW